VCRKRNHCEKRLETNIPGTFTSLDDEIKEKRAAIKSKGIRVAPSKERVDLQEKLAPTLEKYEPYIHTYIHTCIHAYVKKYISMYVWNPICRHCLWTPLFAKVVEHAEYDNMVHALWSDEYNFLCLAELDEGTVCLSVCLSGCVCSCMLDVHACMHLSFYTLHIEVLVGVCV
jgi:hypothetical protein